MIAAVVTILVLSPFVIAYVIGVLLLRRLVRLWIARDVMERFRPTPKDVDRAERELGVA